MKIEITELGLVLVGNINPIIITPTWLAYKGLIPEEEGNQAKVHIIHEEVSKFELDWASIECTRNRFEIKTSNEPFYNPSRDLVCSIFSVLKHTPLSSVGINHIFHLSCDANEHLEIGKRLAPFERWDNVLSEPRLVKLEMWENPRMDGLEGHYLVRIAPSLILGPNQNAIAININNHLSVDDTQKNDSSAIVRLIQSNWDNALGRANHVVAQLRQNLGL